MAAILIRPTGDCRNTVVTRDYINRRCESEKEAGPPGGAVGSRHDSGDYQRDLIGALWGLLSL